MDPYLYQGYLHVSECATDVDYIIFTARRRRRTSINSIELSITFMQQNAITQAKLTNIKLREFIIPEIFKKNIFLGFVFLNLLCISLLIWRGTSPMSNQQHDHSYDGEFNAHCLLNTCGI